MFQITSKNNQHITSFIIDHGNNIYYYENTVQWYNHLLHYVQRTQIDRKPIFNGRFHGVEIKNKINIMLQKQTDWPTRLNNYTHRLQKGLMMALELLHITLLLLQPIVVCLLVVLLLYMILLTIMVYYLCPSLSRCQQYNILLHSNNMCST